MVRVEPAGIELEVPEGVSVMTAAQTAGWYWPTICKGNAQCNRCFVEVVDGVEHSVEMLPTEREGLERVRWRGEEREGERLACQLRVTGPMTVRKVGVKRLES
ncbi:MAG: 2Fe-2S iron-sulfur cluster-binding protein [Actinomycetota bacterium]|mgnify:CR=1 FL=1